MGEPNNTRFYDFEIFEPIAKPQNQLFVSLETPGCLNKSRNCPEHVQKYCFCKYHFLELQVFANCRKHGRREMMKIRLNNLENLGFEINVHQET